MTLPPLPEPHALAVLVLAALALVLFTRERIPIETSSLAVLVALAVGFEWFPYHGEHGHLQAIDLFSGFGHEALIAVCALMICGQGLVRTGALEPVGRQLARLWSVSPALSLLLTLVLGAVLSAFMNNTPIVVLLLPILTSVSLRTNAAPSRVLMPMGLATLVGGMSTTIGTSTNLLVVAVAADLGMRRMGMFDFALPAAIAGTVGIVYLWLVAPRLLPDRRAPMSEASPRVFAAELSIPQDSAAAGGTLAEALALTDGEMQVAHIRRDDDTLLIPLPDARLRADDRLAVDDTPARLKEFESVLGATLYAGTQRVDDEHPLTAENQQIAEIAVVQSSSLDGTSLRHARFIDRYHLVVLALHRAGRALSPTGRDPAAVSLRAGDVLLVQGSADSILALKRDAGLLVLDATLDLPHTGRAPLALAIMGAVIALAATGMLPIAVSATAGALLMVVAGALGWRDATQALSAPVVLVVVASLALGAALTATGGTDYLAGAFLATTAGAPTPVLLAALMLLMATLTNVVSNNAAAVIGTPIAIDIAHGLGLPAEPFVLAVLFGANMSYATPMAYKTNLLVMSAGGYRFADFVRVGTPLTLLMWVVLSVVLPMLYDV